MLREKSRTDEAEAVLRESVGIYKQKSTVDDLDVLWPATSLAEILRQRGDLTAAEPMLRNTLAVRFQKLGEEHPDTLLAMVSVAVVLLAAC